MGLTSHSSAVLLLQCASGKRKQKARSEVLFFNTMKRKKENISVPFLNAALVFRLGQRNSTRSQTQRQGYANPGQCQYGTACNHLEELTQAGQAQGEMVILEVREGFSECSMCVFGGFQTVK